MVEVGDEIDIELVQDSNNTAGLDGKGYNGNFIVDGIIDAYQFTFQNTDTNGVERNTGTFVDTTNSRNLFLPRFSIKNNQKNFTVYRSSVVEPYIKDQNDGVYVLELLNSDYAPPQEFTPKKYKQNVTYYYPQQDRDNIVENSPSAVSFCKRAPLGKVEINDLKNSVTRETIDKFNKSFNIGYAITGITSVSAGIVTVTFENQHDLNGLITHENLVTGVVMP